MQLQVVRTAEGPRLAGAAPEDEQVVNGFLTHLAARAFSPAMVRAYAFDLLNFLRFCANRDLTLARVVRRFVRLPGLAGASGPVPRSVTRVVRLSEHLKRFSSPSAPPRVSPTDLERVPTGTADLTTDHRAPPGAPSSWTASRWGIT
jgi:hypothetical protein